MVGPNWMPLVADMAGILDKTYPALTGSNTTAISSGAVNTTAETSVWSLSIAASRIKAGDLLVCKFESDVFNSSGGTVNYVFKVKVNSTAILTTSSVVMVNNASRARHHGEITLGIGSLTDLRIGGQMFTSTPVGANNMNALAAVALSTIGSGQVTSENLSADATLSMTVTMGTASASADYRPLSAVLLRMRS